MRRFVPLGVAIVAATVFGFPSQYPLHAEEHVDCAQFNIKAAESKALPQATPSQPPSPAQHCAPRSSNGIPLPDPTCTPGAVNPTVTTEVLRNPQFRTSCLRGHASSDGDKEKTYGQYNLRKPEHNTGVMQICELDHLVSLQLGGADTVDNIWPQCGPANVALIHRYFKEKDLVELFLAKQIRHGLMNLDEVQHGIASDWTQYLPAAKEDCRKNHCRSADDDEPAPDSPPGIARTRRIATP